MLEISVPGGEFWIEESEEFIHTKPQKLRLEHSLISISKWESKWKRAFLADRPKTDEQVLDYIRCMTINGDFPPETYAALSQENIDEIMAYIGDSMTATYIYKGFGNDNSSGRGEVLTSELIYYWMVCFNIPVEFQKWHLNRLLTLIDVFEAKNSTKKRKIGEIIKDNRALNEMNKARFNTRG